MSTTGPGRMLLKKKESDTVFPDSQGFISLRSRSQKRMIKKTFMPHLITQICYETETAAHQKRLVCD